MRIALHGSVMLDHVYLVDDFDGRRHQTTVASKSYRQVGALGNTARLLRSRFPQIETIAIASVGDDPDGDWVKNQLRTEGVCTKEVRQIDWAHTSRASIVVDSDKTSIVDIGACRWYPGSERNADWHHFMYLDDLPELTPEQLKKTGTVSADLVMADHTAESRQRLEQFFPLIDYLIISHKESCGLCPEFNLMPEKALALGKKVKQYVIIHDAWNTYASDGQTVVHAKNRPIEGLNVLGAGDYFAGSLIGQSLLASQAGIVERLKVAHVVTEGLLKEVSGVED